MITSQTRYHGESKSAYHERLRTSRKKRERYLRRGKVLWTSCVLQNGKQMLKSWLSEHPRATEAEIAAVTKLYPENQLFKVAISGTYRREPRPINSVTDKELEKLQTQAPADPKVLAALKKDRRKKAQAEARRVAKITTEEVAA